MMMMMMITMMMMMMLMVVVPRMLMIMMIVMKELVMLMTMTKAMRMVMYPILGMKPFGTSEIAVVQRKNFASGKKRGDTHRKMGYPREGYFFFLSSYTLHSLLSPPLGNTLNSRITVMSILLITIIIIVRLWS